MPTPESAAFLAKKPTVPPTFENVDFSDDVAVVNARDAIIREQWVKQMMQRLVGEEMGESFISGLSIMRTRGRTGLGYILGHVNREKSVQTIETRELLM